MSKILLSIGIVLILASCSTQSPLTKYDAYKGVYEEKPTAILLMPPINRSTNVEAKEYFHSTLSRPLADYGYYPISPFLSLEILKKESAYDSELFVESDLSKFGEVFGADVALFTTIHSWDKSSIGSNIKVEVEYLVKSIKTSEILYARRGIINYDTSINTGAGGIFGVIADLAISAINTAATKYIKVARSCNSYTFTDLPCGKYHPMHNLDKTNYAGKAIFNVRLNANSRY